jgi:hypothetical protein
MGKRLTIIVVGTMASDPYAGMAWMNMQLAAGLQRSGHDVYYFEITRAWPYNPLLQMRVKNPEYAVNYVKEVAEGFGLKDHWAYRASYTKDRSWYGMQKSVAESLLANADLVFDVSGATRLTKRQVKNGRLVYYGTDPVYHEIKYSQGDVEIKTMIDEFDDLVSFGENIGTAFCPIPHLPRLRAVTRQPILMDLWENNIVPENKFTTVGNWKQGGRDLVFNGETYHWSKHHEFLKFIDLPDRVDQPIELAMNLAKPESFKHGRGTVVPAMGVADSEYELLMKNGWKLADAPSFTMQPWPYRDYIFKSKAEFTFAKDQNVRLKSGWFSERSACYLAAGRPVITQDTGFGHSIPTGNGLFAFNTLEEIQTAFDKINTNYEMQSKAAKEIAEEYFRAETVLSKLLKDLGY